MLDAHHLRELTRAYEQDNQAWTEEMRVFLVALNQEVDNVDGLLSDERQDSLLRHYQRIIKVGEMESPAPIPVKGKRGDLRKPNHVPT